MTTVYVRLLDEGTDVFRPTEANALEDGAFVLLPTPDYDPADEQWEFRPGSVVRIGSRMFEGEAALVVAYLASDAEEIKERHQ